VILSACSPFFRTILRRNRHEHPLLYLKGVKYADLVSVLNFMYHGEVNVAQEELNSFLAVAEELKVKGLTQNSSGGSSKPPPPSRPAPAPHASTPPPPKRPRPLPPSAPLARPQTSYQEEDDDIQEVAPLVKEEPRTLAGAEPPLDTSGALEQYGEEAYGDEQYYEGDYEASGAMGDPALAGADGNKDLNAILESMISRCEGEERLKYMCNTCGKTMTDKTKMKRHAEVHIDALHSCVMCHKQFQTRNALAIHTSRYHSGAVASPWSTTT